MTRPLKTIELIEGLTLSEVGERKGRSGRRVAVLLAESVADACGERGDDLRRVQRSGAGGGRDGGQRRQRRHDELRRALVRVGPNLTKPNLI